jgi:hypothetical protein
MPDSFNPAAAITPINVTIAGGMARWGVGRSSLYRDAGDGKIIMRKAGKRTLVDVASGDAYYGNLPVAKIKAPAEAASTFRPATNPASLATPVTPAAPTPKRRGPGFPLNPKSRPPSAPVTSPPAQLTEQLTPSESR